MKILVSGCSFSQWPEYPGGPNTCWPRYLAEARPDTTVRNVSEAAAGNQYICDSVIREVSQDRPDMVLVMWSGVSRLDYLTSIEDPAWNSLFDSYGFYRRIPGDKLGWIFSGGQMGTWFKHPVAHKMFNEMYKVSSNLSLAHINLMEIVKLQNFLKAQGIRYKFMSYVNYWGSGEHISPNGDFGLADLPEIKYLVDSIDFSQWAFTNGNKDGIYELAKKNSDFMDDGFHPNTKTHQEWANFITSLI